MISPRPSVGTRALSSVGRASGLQPEGRGFKSPSVHFACHRFLTWTLRHALRSRGSLQSVGPSVHLACHRYLTWTLRHALRSRGSLQGVGPSVHFPCQRFEVWTLFHGLPCLRSVQPVGPSVSLACHARWRGHCAMPFARGTCCRPLTLASTLLPDQSRITKNASNSNTTFR